MHRDYFKMEKYTIFMIFQPVWIKNKGMNCTLCAPISHFVTFCPVTGHGSIFSCCQNDNLRELPLSFFMIHILGGMVLFMTDGIVVSEECR